MAVEIRPLEAEFNFPKIPSKITKELEYFLLELRNFLHRKFIERLVVAGDLQIGGEIIHKTEIISGISIATITAINNDTISCTVDNQSVTVYPLKKGSNNLSGDVHQKYSVGDKIAVFKSSDIWYAVVPFRDTIEY